MEQAVRIMFWTCIALTVAVLIVPILYPPQVAAEDGPAAISEKVKSLGGGVYVLDIRDANRDINNMLGWAPMLKEFMDTMPNDEEVVDMEVGNVTGHGNVLSIVILTRKK